MMNNAAIALDHMQITPAEWLAQVDAGVQATFEKLIRRGQYREAYLFLGSHLAKTETTRRRIHGAGPTIADATSGYSDCYYRNFHDVAARLVTRISVLLPSSGASTATVPGTSPAGRGPKDCDLTASSDPGAAVELPPTVAGGVAPGSCAPDENHNRLRDLLDDIEGPEPCDHQRGRWTCIRGVHPFNPNGHVYVSSTGSHVGDRHFDGAEDQ